MIERDHPHLVLIAVPPGGLGSRIDEMRRYCLRTLGVPEMRGEGLRADGVDCASWCFAAPEMADRFAAAFGGRRELSRHRW